MMATRWWHMADISKLGPYVLENQLWNHGYRIVGIDEAGRGTWAGPLKVGAVWLKPQHVVMLVDTNNIRDSKKMTSRQRVRVYRQLLDWGIEFAVGEAMPQEIDEKGIEEAFKTATARALHGLIAQGLLQFPVTPEEPLAVLIDGERYSDLETVAGVEVFAADRLEDSSVAVALASIAAKVHQETNMKGLDFLYPEYGFAQSNGYPTPAHKAAVEKHGLAQPHRKSWAV